jgi:nickel/cobalt transporter (NicO) family protein
MNDADTRKHIRAIVSAASAAALFTIAAVHPAHAQFGSFGGPRPVAMSSIAGWILAEQAMFYRTLAGAIRQSATNGTALWSLMAISFVYGIFHAAGPGHGKAVISSYIMANDETWRRGLTLSFASAVMQSLTAIAIVGIAAVLLGATAKLISNTVNLIETAGYVLIVLIGARLLWVKGRGFAGAVRDLRAERSRDDAGGAGGAAHCALCAPPRVLQAAASPALSPFSGDPAAPGVFHCEGDRHHHHGEDLDVLPWGHAHGPEPADLAGPGGWRRGLSAIVAVGLRPCSGAIIVLVFALSQGLFWTGIASTFVMGLGTSITVGTIATLAVGAKAAAKRFVGRRAGYAGLFVRGVEVIAGGLVLCFGVLLLTGYMASERMGLF